MLSRIERGQVSPSMETLERLASGLGLPASRFFSDRARRTDVCHVRARQGVSSLAWVRLQAIATSCWVT